MKLIIIIVVILVLVAGGGAVTWFFVLDDPNKSAEAEPAPVVDPIFLELDTLNVHVIRGGGVQKYIRLDVTLEMRDAEAKAFAEKKIPKLRDVFISALNDCFTNLPSLKKGLNIPQIKRRLISHSEKALGKGAITDVLVQGAIEADWKPQK